MFLVIECNNRELSQVIPAKDKADAQEKANAMLANHLEKIGYSRTEPESTNLKRADFENNEYCAWCSLGDENYDAYCFEPGAAQSMAILDFLLAERREHNGR